MPESVTAAARRAGVMVREYTSLDEVLQDTDVLYVTRVQRERFESDEAYERVKNAYVINQAVLARAKEDMIVMHPLPRLQGE
jgi:carbamoyl-phosphate synthase/aspartate carbamoyltransferase